MSNVIFKIESDTHFGIIYFYIYEIHNKIEEGVVSNSIAHTIKMILRKIKRFKTITKKNLKK